MEVSLLAYNWLIINSKTIRSWHSEWEKYKLHKSVLLSLQSSKNITETHDDLRKKWETFVEKFNDETKSSLLSLNEISLDSFHRDFYQPWYQLEGLMKNEQVSSSIIHDLYNTLHIQLISSLKMGGLMEGCLPINNPTDIQLLLFSSGERNRAIYEILLYIQFLFEEERFPDIKKLVNKSERINRNNPYIQYHQVFDFLESNEKICARRKQRSGDIHAIAKTIKEDDVLPTVLKASVFPIQEAKLKKINSKSLNDKANIFTEYILNSYD